MNLRVITGSISLVCFVLLAVKYPLRKLGLHKLNGALMKLHEAASGILCLSGIAHIILVFPVLSGRGVALPLIGGAAFLLLLWIIAACHMMKDLKKRMDWHRWLSLAAFTAIAAHVAAYWLT